MKLRKELAAEDVATFGADPKIGLLATVDPGGLPHVTLITTLQATAPTRLTFGQFCEGRSKSNLRRDPHAAFLVMTLGRDVWRGRALWTGEACEGDDYEAYNRKPLFRYNSYFGIHTVHFLDLVGVTARGRLNVPVMAAGAIAARAAAPFAHRRRAEPALKPWAQGLVGRLDSLKVASWVDDEGFPTLVPAVPCAAADASRLVLVSTSRELAAIPRGRPVAIFALSLKLESVLVRGRLSGGPGVATLDVDHVYNSMPPRQGQVHPMPPLEPVTTW